MKFAKAGILYMANVGRVRAAITARPVELPSHLVAPDGLGPHTWQSELGFVSHLKNSLSNASSGARCPGALPKNCHLLPSTAILEPQNR